MAINALLPMLFVERLGSAAPFDLRPLGTLGGGAVAFLLSDLAGYWLHRAQHEVRWLWLATHQMHHSAERVDVMGAAYFHPLDIAAQTVVTTLVTGLLGVTPDAAALSGLLVVLLAVFQHLNLRTPRRLGYLIQRPEGHAVHHARGVHAYNYGNLGLWDLVFGTFRNPSGFATEAGFVDGASRRVGAMLVFRDVSAPSGSEGAEVTSRRAVSVALR
jgi:sterol desaturase/sphingolipid hydroxylase (fatty acid hydroxylase superfamily)